MKPMLTILGFRGCDRRTPTATIEEAARVAYDEDCKFYDNNKHIIDDEKMSFPAFKAATIKNADLVKVFAMKSAGHIDEKPEEDPAKVLDPLKQGKGRKVDSIEAMLDFIATVATVKGVKFSEVSFCELQSIPDPNGLFKEHVKNIGDMNDLVKEYSGDLPEDKSDDESDVQEPATKRSRRTTSAKAVAKAAAEGTGLSLERGGHSTSTSRDSSVVEAGPSAKKRKRIQQAYDEDSSMDDFEEDLPSQVMKKKSGKEKKGKSAVVCKKDSNMAKRKSSKKSEAAEKKKKADDDEIRVITHDNPSFPSHLAQESSEAESADEGVDNPSHLEPPALDEEQLENLPPQLSSHMEDSRQVEQETSHNEGDDNQQNVEKPVEDIDEAVVEAADDDEDETIMPTQEENRGKSLSQMSTRTSGRLQRKKKTDESAKNETV